MECKWERTERSWVFDANRALSWFSEKVPRRVESGQLSLMSEMAEARADMEPEVDWKAFIRG